MKYFRTISNLRAVPHSLTLIALIVSWSSSAQAQSAPPRVEIFGGFSYLHTDFQFPAIAHGDNRGWNVSATFNVRSWFGLVADFSGYRGSSILSCRTCTP